MATEKRLIVKNCENCINSGRPSYEYPCTACTTAHGSAPSKWESTFSTGDFVEVVRCKDCKWYNKEFNVCEFWHGSRQPNHYCKEGVAKENE